MKSSHYSLCVLVLLATVFSCFGRPQTTIDSQPDVPLSSEMDTPPLSASQAAWRKLYFEPAALQRYQSFMEDAQPLPGSTLERIKMEILSRLQEPNAISGGGYGLSREPMYRLPEMKRQVRYRQCYFNPISCFKK